MTKTSGVRGAARASATTFPKSILLPARDPGRLSFFHGLITANVAKFLRSANEGSFTLSLFFRRQGFVAHALNFLLGQIKGLSRTLLARLLSAPFTGERYRKQTSDSLRPREVVVLPNDPLIDSFDLWLMQPE